jgi:hypothetical protein
MAASVISLFLCTALAADKPQASAKPATLSFFADADWYKKETAAEQTFEGTIERNVAGGQIGKATRFNTYLLTWSTPDGTRVVREVYAPGKAQFLAVHVGKRVRVIGKTVDTKADGKVYAELWPARLEPVGLISPDVQNGILARCTWQPAAAKRRDESTWVITGGMDLARHFGYFGADVDQRASQDIARALQVPKIDWTKQMLVCVAAGMHVNGERIRVTRVALKDKVLIVSYRLERPDNAPAGICYPAETVLVDRFNGEVKYEAEASK